MATGKRFYWIKLKESFIASDTVDYMLGQKNGASYVLIFLMLCLKTANSGGKMVQTIGDITVPYDVAKIQRDLKYFPASTIQSALRLYRQLGMIEDDRQGILSIKNYGDLIGCETDWADKKRRIRGGNPGETGDTSGDNVPAMSPVDGGNIPPADGDTGGENVPTDIRYKEIREKRLEIRDINSGGNSGISYADDSRRRCRPDFDTLEAYASSNLHHMSPTNLEELVSFRDAIPDELIRHGIDEACASGHPTYGYARSILNRYVSSGYKSVGDAKADDSRRTKSMQERDGKPVNPALDYEQHKYTESDFAGLYLDLLAGDQSGGNDSDVGG